MELRWRLNKWPSRQILINLHHIRITLCFKKRYLVYYPLLNKFLERMTNKTRYLVWNYSNYLYNHDNGILVKFHTNHQNL
jgi:hypothetical protein